MESKNLSEILNSDELKYVNQCLQKGDLKNLRSYLNSDIKIKLIADGIYPDYLYYYLVYSSTKNSVQNLDNSLNKKKWNTAIVFLK